MEILVSEIPPEGLIVDCAKNEEWLESRMAGMMPDGLFVNNIAFHCTIVRTGRQVTITGNLEAHCSASCTRCLESYPLQMKSDFFYALLPSASVHEAEYDLELGADDLESGLYDNDRIDLEPLFVEQVVLQIPIRTVCSDRCRGLCSTCGANLNRTDCRHETTMKADSPFAVLKHYKVPEKRS